MSEEELKEMEEAFLGSSQAEFHFIQGRLKEEKLVRRKLPSGEIVDEKITAQLDPRWDLYTGPEISEEEIRRSDQNVTDRAALIKFEGRQQICHFHKESPRIYENAVNVNGDAHFFMVAHRLIPKMLLEIKRLQALSLS